jgi:hypothetical protein
MDEKLCCFVGKVSMIRRPDPLLTMPGHRSHMLIDQTGSYNSQDPTRVRVHGCAVFFSVRHLGSDEIRVNTEFRIMPSKIPVSRDSSIFQQLRVINDLKRSALSGELLPAVSNSNQKTRWAARRGRLASRG